MSKKALLAAVILMVMLICTGCWNYISLNDMSIVSGITVDLIPQSSIFQLGFEVVDLTKNVKNNGLSTILIESTGKTIFDAARNAKMRVDNKLYFGNVVILVISDEIARNGQLTQIIDWYLRDAELRETLYVIVSQEKTAEDILKIEGINSAVIAFEVEKIISADHTVTSSIPSYPLYQVFDILHDQGKSLVLPAFRNVINDDTPTIEANGSAVFKENNLLGYLTPEETKYFLFAIGQVKGGLLTMADYGESHNNVSLEISRNNTKCSYVLQDGKLKVNVDVKTDVFLAEINYPFNSLDKGQVISLEADAGAFLQQGIERVIRRVQSEFHSDIFGFGSEIHRSNPKLWKQISDNWNEGYFPTLEVTVNTKVNILNSAYIKDTKLEKMK